MKLKPTARVYVPLYLNSEYGNREQESASRPLDLGFMGKPKFQLIEELHGIGTGYLWAYYTVENQNALTSNRNNKG